ncbi:MAG: hypothetical protein K2G94_05805 [Muribaculaceae bacterium]|nr:hypothetical protein [Muribaculaceae bacterium]MDE5959180.1 hypothetical protein [Muribaculaceae bacterium]MDE5972244.1 hypothetical protein [Muribaculaceae bacterium]MDE6461212.1 hypothetical protein [Muribaculaceae bacterium]MDE6509013.1 hypothetical protein [Muribaculaceae bacterium]
MKHAHTLDSLHSLCYIINSDDDQPVVQDLAAGFDMNDNLVIAIDNIDYEDRHNNCSTAIIVSRHDAQRIARRHRIKYHCLPQFIGECMAEWKEIINPTFNHVQTCFKEISECLLDEGCRMRIRRTYGRNGFICC